MPGSSPRPPLTEADIAAAWAGLGNPGRADARHACRGQSAGPLASGLLAQPRVIAVDGPPGTIEYLVPARRCSCRLPTPRSRCDSGHSSMAPPTPRK